MTTASASIIARVQKLLALADRNDSLHEAEAAAKRAQELIARYQISQAALSVKQETQAPIQTTIIHRSRRVATWIVLLAQAIGRENGCETFYTPKLGIYCVGTEDDIAIVSALLAALEIRVVAACKAASRAVRRTRSEGRIFSTQFKMGAVSAIEERLREASRHVELTHDDGRMLPAIITHKLVRAKAALPRLRSTRVSQRRHDDGFAQGRAAGQRMSLQPGARGRRLLT